MKQIHLSLCFTKAENYKSAEGEKPAEGGESEEEQVIEGGIANVGESLKESMRQERERIGNEWLTNQGVAKALTKLGKGAKSVEELVERAVADSSDERTRQRLQSLLDFDSTRQRLEELLAQANKGKEDEVTEWFGPVYTQFQGKGAEAEAYLCDKCEGVAKGALTHPDLSPIDLAWGDAKAGYMKIVVKHPEVVGKLQEIISGTKVMQQSENRAVLESATHKIVVSKKKGAIPTDNWLLTAYEKKERPASASSSDIETEPMGKQNGTATLQNEPSFGGKVSKTLGDGQIKGEKIETNSPVPVFRK